MADTEDMHEDYCIQVSSLFAEIQRCMGVLEADQRNHAALQSLHRALHTWKTDAEIMDDAKLAAEAAQIEGFCESCLQQDGLSEDQLTQLQKHIAVLKSLKEEMNCE